jgi:FkbM family methyltransferase
VKLRACVDARRPGIVDRLMRSCSPHPVVRRFIELALDRAGIFARRRSDLPRGFDWLIDVERLLAPRRPIVALDIGANVGQTTLSIKRQFPSATVHAFEPVRSTFETLRATVGHLSDVQCHDVALSDEEGTRTIPILPGSVFNSLVSPLWNDEKKAVREEVRLTTLDRFAAGRGIGAIDLVKSDTEGHDMAVLIGARQQLAEAGARCVYVEVTFSPVNRQNSLFSPIFDFLGALGYRFMGLYDMHYFQVNPWDESFCNALFWKAR